MHLLKTKFLVEKLRRPSLLQDVRDEKPNVCLTTMTHATKRHLSDQLTTFIHWVLDMYCAFHGV
jgi:hypothetical protein